MRLIVEYEVGDRYTYSATVTVPVVYESPEAFIVDFEEMCKDWLTKKEGRWSDEQFMLADQEWFASNHHEDGEYVSPRIMTVDEFFETVEK